MTAQYSATVAVQNMLQNREWFGKYELSDRYDRLTEEEQEYAYVISVSVVQLVYFIQVKRLGEWEADDLEEIMTYNLPVQIAAQPDFFEAVEPVLKGYLSFLGSEKLIRNTDGLIARVHEVAPTMVSYAANDNMWSANKILGMQMIYGDVSLKEASDLAEYEQTTNFGVPIIKATRPRPKHHFTGNVVELNDALREKYRKSNSDK
ncbi:hypothetical protein LOSG293_040440 [Secundilactobacillus oryzae JCM 18671]|uniref:Uncharacterized protein n=1 Tax=Secundilactobacillus oryzae JCM 18671 TaxID=1291743 RepID=A0A081BGY0_9LACO|nr:hypothetical protein [Secundilactobacillus oryzae]GAK47298.1 hypothetical protein LOSG293_040440 [Secundilactobacillus oryzae JCM 18671]